MQTNPLPVILPGATSLPGATALPRPEPVAAPRGFFEAARREAAPPEPRPFSATGVVGPSAAEPAGDAGASGGREHEFPGIASAKLEQIKDLYLTAEAIGEEALDKHFDQVSDRQRQLIRDFFNQPGPGPGGRP